MSVQCLYTIRWLFVRANKCWIKVIQIHAERMARSSHMSKFKQIQNEKWKKYPKTEACAFSHEYVWKSVGKTMRKYETLAQLYSVEWHRCSGPIILSIIILYGSNVYKIKSTKKCKITYFISKAMNRQINLHCNWNGFLGSLRVVHYSD